MNDSNQNLPDTQKMASNENRLVRLLEKQKTELVIRVLKKHEELQAGKEFTNKILTSLAELFFLLDKDLFVVQCNSEFTRCLGYALDKKKPLSLADLVDQENYTMICEALTDGEFAIIETNIRAYNGREVPVTLKGSTYVTESGRVLHMFIASDKSDFYKMMSRMREVQDQLTHSARLASLGEMAAGISHELTQPLNAILLLTRNALKGMQDPLANRKMLEENLSIIIDRVNKASSIINSLKSFASKAKDTMVPVKINVIILDILNFFESQFTLSDIGLYLQLDTHQTIEVMGQEVKFEQVFFNLIQNAILSMGKTTKPQLTISTAIKTSINPTTLREEPFVLIAVRDNGEGIPQANQDKIFDPFFTTRAAGSGMGLGLSIVDRIVRSFGGYIKVDSTPGEGTCFTVYLPAHLEKI
ncbi:MAG: PAS domain-containing protein [Proteobacteria bacterium]|nr:PAS domain-containing protein [Pseudomonadota bacterium]